MDYLIEADRFLFKQLNGEWHNRFFDVIMPFIRNSMTWVPFYLFMILFVFRNFKQQGWWWLLFAICTPMVTDLVSSGLIKNHVMRTRPCNDPSLADSMRFLLNYRPQSSSFTSSHATNHFGLAMYLYATLYRHIGKWAWFFFAWAFIIIYAQVYVGVHYPLDVAAGALIGTFFGYLSSRIYHRYHILA